MHMLLLLLFTAAYSKCTTSTRTSQISVIPPLIPHINTIIQVNSLQKHFQYIVLAKYSNFTQVIYNATSQEWTSDNDFSSANSWIFMNESSLIVVNPAQVKSESLYISLLLCDYISEDSFDVKIINKPTAYCPNNCNNNGKCSDEGCICSKGFIGLDCAMGISELALNKKINLSLSPNAWLAFFVLLKDNKKLSISVKNKTSGELFAFFKSSNSTDNLPSLADYQKSFYFNTGDELNFSSSQIYTFVNFFCDSLEDCNAQIYCKEKNSSSNIGVNEIVSISFAAGLSVIIILIIIICRIYKFYTKWNREQEIKRIAQDIMITYPETQWMQTLNCYTCSICFEDFNTNSMTRIFNCGHAFHTECIDKWLNLKPLCPSCKNQLLVKNES
ncbi:hypothetical protein SteCoe_26304 [Stentor coeruleus]|uniref:RING-type domain-containing protein n=1 Tax=Stentor coeruleus TaxID=5963 RepID=A0A1R2BD84_9CILI|nr:hypothetical protein SteCoe_26304 [Stentor coeruleus]